MILPLIGIFAENHSEAGSGLVHSARVVCYEPPGGCVPAPDGGHGGGRGALYGHARTRRVRHVTVRLPGRGRGRGRGVVAVPGPRWRWWRGLVVVLMMTGAGAGAGPGNIIARCDSDL